MQVSWIDPEEIARLTAELNGPLPPPETISPWELSTLPDITADALLPQVNITTPVPATTSGAASAPPQPTAALTHQPQLDHIREKLRAIRARAQDAGLLPPKTEPPAPVPVPTPVPAAPPVFTPAPVPGPSLEPALAAMEPPAVGEDEPPPTTHLPHSPGVPPLAAVTPAPTPEALPTTPVGTPAYTPSSARAFLNLDGNLGERLASFMSWAERYTPCHELLLVDDHGELLWGNPSHPELALSAVLAANASLRSGAAAFTQPASTTLQLSPDRHLTVLPCTTKLGLVTLALVNASPAPTQDQIACLREALTLSVEGKPDGH